MSSTVSAEWRGSLFLVFNYHEVGAVKSGRNFISLQKKECEQSANPFIPHLSRQSQVRKPAKPAKPVSGSTQLFSRVHSPAASDAVFGVDILSSGKLHRRCSSS